ncbi:MAG: hypothetical protein M3340_09590 [Actinomycetota bacterium]|nr:hypothetical protein [Actinomycetota bacterium]
MQRAGLIVGNPAARGVSDELLREVGRRAGASLDRVLLQRTTRPGEAVELVADAIRDIAPSALELTTVIAVGGDGTVREVA